MASRTPRPAWFVRYGIRPGVATVVHQECQGNPDLKYIGEYNGRVVEATYDLINDTIVIAGVKIKTAGTWEMQTGKELERIGQWMIEEYGDDMMMTAV